MRKGKWIAICFSFLLTLTMIGNSVDFSVVFAAGNDQNGLETQIVEDRVISEEKNEGYESDSQETETEGDIETNKPEQGEMEGIEELEEKEITEPEETYDQDIENSEEVQVQPFSVKQPALTAFYSKDTELTHDIRTISLRKSWRGDTLSERPESVTFSLYQGDNSEPIDTLTMTKEDAVDGSENIWESQFDGKYPIYDESGEEIVYTVKEAELEGYRSVQSGVDETTSEGYENVSAFVPVTAVEQGQDYLVSSGMEGDVSLYRAEAYQTDGILATENGMVKAVKDGRVLEEEREDGTYQSYTDYILISDEIVDGENTTDYMTWRADIAGDGSTVLASNCYRLWGEKEENDPGKWPGYLSTEKDKRDGLCMYKKEISDVNAAPASTRFYYDEATGGFKTEGSEKVIYLYKKINLREGTFRTATSNFKFMNTKYSATSDDPLDHGEEEPEPFTNVSVEKRWTDGNENHVGDSVTVVLKANGVAADELVLNAENDWKGSFTGLETTDADGKEIVYTVEEKSTSGYLSEIEEKDTEKGNVWLPVDRPTKAAGGGDYIVLAFPNNKSEIGQDIWEDGDHDGKAERIALTSNPAGTKFALGSKNNQNTDGASMDVTVTEGPLSVNGKTYTNYIKDSEAHNADGSDRETIIWNVEFQKTGSKKDYGPWERDLFSFKALAGKGGYLSTQGAMTLEKKLDLGNNSRTLFAYGMICEPEWGEFDSMSSQGYTEDQLTHMIGAMDHYALRSDKSPGKFGEKDCTYPAMYLYKKVEVTNHSYVLTNRPAEKIQVSVKKIWRDHDDQDSIRPANIKVELFKNGWATGLTYDLSDSNNWQCVFENLDKTDEAGNLIQYTVKEYVSNADQYEVEYTVTTDEDGNVSIEICNTQKEVVKPIVMPETGSRGKQKMIWTGVWLLLAGTLLIIKIQGKKGRQGKGQKE